MNPADLIAFAVAAGAWAAVYYQARSVRVAEAQFASQLESLGEVVARLEEERKARENAVASETAARSRAIEVTADALHRRAWEDHRVTWDHTSNTHVLQNLFLTQLSLAVSVLVNHFLSPASAETERERLLAVAGLADAVCLSAGLEADYTRYVVESRAEGRQVQRVERVFGDRHKKATQTWTEANAALAALVQKLSAPTGGQPSRS